MLSGISATSCSTATTTRLGRSSLGQGREDGRRHEHLLSGTAHGVLLGTHRIDRTNSNLLLHKLDHLYRLLVNDRHLLNTILLLHHLLQNDLNLFSIYLRI